MSELNFDTMLQIVISRSDKLNITAYDYGKNTSISTMTAHNILSGNNKNPRAKTLEVMIDYLETKEAVKQVKEESAEYVTPDKPITEERIIELIHQVTDARFKEINADILRLFRNNLDMLPTSKPDADSKTS